MPNQEADSTHPQVKNQSTRRKVMTQQWKYAELRVLGYGKITSFKRAYKPGPHSHPKLLAYRAGKVEGSARVQRMMEEIQDSIRANENLTGAEVVSNLRHLAESAVEMGEEGNKISGFDTARRCWESIAKICGLMDSKLKIEVEDLNETQMFSELTDLLRENPELISEAIKDNPHLLEAVAVEQLIPGAKRKAKKVRSRVKKAEPVKALPPGGKQEGKD